MSVVLDLPADLESKLAAEASRHGISLADYLLKILSNGNKQNASVRTGAELVAYWRQAGIVGTRSHVDDSQRRARQIRAEAEQRRHS
jgi:hypothetical protein